MQIRKSRGCSIVPASATLALLAGLLAGCGGGGSNSNPPPSPTPPPAPAPPPEPALDPQYRASATSTLAANCDGAPQSGFVNVNAEVESSVAVNPANTRNLIGMWQQDRWSNGGARALVSGFSNDGGQTWERRVMPFSRCGGGTAANGGDYDRATDPWVSISPNGTAHQTGLAFSGASLQAGSSSAILVNRSTDGGATWGPTITLIRDGAEFFNDKNTISADPTDSRFVYAVWDRLTRGNEGPTYFSRSTDGGLGWESARPIYNPGVNNQTIGNVIAVSPNGTLVNLFMNLTGAANNTFTAAVDVIRSSDNGVTWSAPIRIASVLSVGTRDPDAGTPVRDSSLVPQIAVTPNGHFIAVWQDSRFSNGARDGIALSRSIDGGLTWSAPVQVNSNPGVAAFSPFVHVRGDGMIGVSYFDFRSNTPATATLSTDHRLARSTDTANWQDSRIAQFDLAFAARAVSTGASALFIGDYHSLTSIGNVFVPFFVRTTADTGNRSDVFAAPTTSVTSIAAITETSAGDTNPVTGFKAMPAKPFDVTPDWQRRVHENIVRGLHESWYSNWKARHPSAPNVATAPK